MTFITIINERPKGRRVALYNEAGLDYGALRRLDELASLYAATVQAFPGYTVYVEAINIRDVGAETFAQAYIDYTEDADCTARLARLAAYLAKNPALPPGLECTYYSEDRILHIGIWVEVATQRSVVDQWDALLAAIA